MQLRTELNPSRVAWTATLLFAAMQCTTILTLVQRLARHVLSPAVHLRIDW